MSWIFSLISLASRVISDDYSVFTKKFQKIECHWEHFPCFNVKYIYRAVFRWMDVFGRISLPSLTWITAKGFVTSVLIGIDFAVIFFMALTFQKYHSSTNVFFFFFFFFFVFLFVVQTHCTTVRLRTHTYTHIDTNIKKKKLEISKIVIKSILAFPFPCSKYFYFWCYRCIMNTIVFVSILLIRSVLPFDDRYHLLFEYNFGLFMIILTAIAAIITPITYLILGELFEILSPFEFQNEDANEDRSFHAMFANNAFNDIMECAEYGIIPFKKEQLSAKHVENKLFFLKFFFMCFSDCV